MSATEDLSSVEEDIKESRPSSPATEIDTQGDLKDDKIGDEDENKITVTTNSSDKNDREGNCYCGKERNLNLVELLCANCNRWFHESCISYHLGKLVPFMTNYVFVCKNCSSTGLESFKKNSPSFPQLCATAIANLMQASASDGSSRSKFHKDKEIIPFVESNWEGLTTINKKIKQSFHSSVMRALAKETNLTFGMEESLEEGCLYFLIQQDLASMKPNYDLMIKQGQLKVTNMGIQHVSASVGAPLRRNAKRKLPDTGQIGGKKSRGDLSQPKLPSHGYPLEHPFNKDGYRYIIAEPDPHAPFRQEFDESSDWAGKPIPGWLYRTLVPTTVLLALHDRAPQLRISDDRLTVTGEKGYSMVRATHSVSRGAWFYEVTVKDMKEGCASRIGWAQEYGNLQAPLGYDKFGYAWRSRKGTRFHESKGKHYSSSYGEGDVLGFLIDLPYDIKCARVPPTYKDKPLVKFKSHLYYEEKDRVADYLKKLKPNNGSKIIFFKNGVCQGDAFLDVYKGAYYPAISLHKNATVRVNFGPEFKYPPDLRKFNNYQGMCFKGEESCVEQTMADVLYLTENDGKLRLETYAV